MKKSIIFIITLCFTLVSFAQNSFEYIVESIPYQTFQEQDIVQFNFDDVHSGIIDLPFPFDFYEDQNITQFVVGSNGTITFDITEANQYQAWSFDPDQLIPDVNLPIPAILGAYHDIDNSVSGNGGVYTGITGVSPNRRFHVTFEDIPNFTSACNPLLSTFQMILHETSGIIDVVITNKPICPAWNDGLTVVGLQALVNDEVHGIAAPGRNTSLWEAQEEAWRFTPTSFLNGFEVVICDVDNDNTQAYNIDAYKTTILGLFNLEDGTNTVSITDTSSAEVSGDVSIGTGDNAFTIDINNGTQLFDLNITLVNCEEDGDTDGLTNGEEDTNGNGNLNDDDTDGDGIPNYLDDDDDGDSVLTSIELVFADRNASATTLDTDLDGIPNHLDFDDDGDGVLTLDEDYNGNGDPTDDDINTNGVPDYLEADVLNVDAVSLNSTLFTVYPIPAISDINVLFSENIGFEGSELISRVYDIQGRLVLEQKQIVFDSRFKMDVSELNSGNYILLIQKDGLTRAKKFVVE